MKYYRILKPSVSTTLCVAGSLIVSGMAMPNVRTKVHGLFNIHEDKQVLFDAVATNAGMAIAMFGWGAKEVAKTTQFFCTPADRSTDPNHWTIVDIVDNESNTLYDIYKITKGVAK